MFTLGAIISQDRDFGIESGAERERFLLNFMQAKGYDVKKSVVLPLEEDLWVEELVYMSDLLKTDLILTWGGTGLDKQDVVPEATMKVINREIQGIAEAIRHHSLQISPHALLSRGISGIRKNTLIINLPEDSKASQRALEYILPSIVQALEVLKK